MSMTVGTGEFRFEPQPDWARLPEGWSFGEAVGVASDSRGRVFIFDRGVHPVIVLSPEGEFLDAWGEDRFARPHGITIGPDDMLYLTDDVDHTVRKFTPEGKLLFRLGMSGTGSDTGIQDGDLRTIARGGPPFNKPTNLAIAENGDLFISDGYGNARVHRFSADGLLQHSWGEPGSGPGQFMLPHGIAVDRQGRVVVADRENSRLQFFSPEGEFLEEWTDVVRPTDVFVDPAGNLFVSELGARVGLFPWMSPDPSRSGGRVSVFAADGSLLARWGGGDDPQSPGDFLAPHDLWLDGEGNLLVGEVVQAAARLTPGGVPPGCPTLRRFRRVAS